MWIKTQDQNTIVNSKQIVTISIQAGGDLFAKTTNDNRIYLGSYNSEAECRMKFEDLYNYIADEMPGAEGWYEC